MEGGKFLELNSSSLRGIKDIKRDRGIGEKD
jgi:hypothetical protein